MNIEYARQATKEEVDNFFSYLKSKKDKKSMSCENVLSDNFDLLIRKYKEYESAIFAENEEIERIYKLELKSINDDKCTCGSDLRYISSHGFYGCVNYRSKGYHKNFKNKDGSLRVPYKRSPDKAKSYLSDIISELGLKQKLKAKALHQFYTNQGLDDLKLKYLGEPYDILINRYAEVKKTAKDFENYCYTRLLPLYTNVIKEFPIRYKLFGESDNICSIDILCSNEKEVDIYECKTTKSDINPDQNNLYLSLIKFICRHKRPVKITNLTDKDKSGFEDIERRELWIKNGKIFGYKPCCIDHFLNKNTSDWQLKINMNTGFTPCKKCAETVEYPRDLEKLLVNRTCELEFPFHDKKYIKLFKDNIPDYFLNKKHDKL